MPEHRGLFAIDTQFPKEGTLFTAHDLPPALNDALIDVERELYCPIRVIRQRRGAIPGWVAEHVDATYPENVTSDQLADARERGITVLLTGFDSPPVRYETIHADGWTMYDIPQAAEPPAAPIEYESIVIGRVESRLVREYMSIQNYIEYELPDGMVEALIEGVRLAADDEFCATLAGQQASRERTALREYFRTTQNRQLDERREQVTTMEQRLAEYKASIATTVQQLRDHQRMIDAMLIVQREETGENILSQWEQLSQHPRIDSARFTDNSIMLVTTDDIRLHRPDSDETRWLGSFEITIDIQSLNVKLRNLDTPRGGRDHPHVVDGRPCFGGHDTGFYELLGRGELFTVFELLIQYLETLNIHDEYGRYGSYWFDVPDERPMRELVAA